MHDLNAALDELRSVIPYAHGTTVRKLSKIATLLLAKNHIIMQDAPDRGNGRLAKLITCYFKTSMMSNGPSSASFQSPQNYQSKENYVTVLAIYDDPQPADGIVEITNIERPPTNGLKVSTDSDILPSKKQSVLSIRRTPDGRSSINIPKSQSEMSHLGRTSARKSRFTDAFLEAQERLEVQQETSSEFQVEPGSRVKSFTVTLPPETVDTALGIEISTVPDPNDDRGRKILAVEVRHIDDDGRIAREGSIKVGDLITEINHRPVYQMSLPKAQARLRELTSIPSPIIVVNRRLKSPRIDRERSASVPRPVATALQMANTAKIGETASIEVEKSSNGFGFGVKSRVNAMNERLAYINNVSITGPAYNKLKTGDRLLKINNTDVGSFSQKEVVQMLKDIPIGTTVEFHISRIIEDQNSKENERNSDPLIETPSPTALTDICHKRRQSAFVDIGDEYVEYLTLDVALQGSKSAGLGISLKGGKLYPERGKLEDGVDCGLFVNGILHGSAAYKDGRFHENDRLIGIENVDLRSYQHNADALAAFSRTLAGVQGQIVEIKIARAKDPQASIRLVKDTTRRINIIRSESESSLAPDSDPFSRENPNRKSISEKRPFASGNDAINTRTYQKIVHQRQTSAPQIRSSTLENHPVSEFKKRQASLTLMNKKFTLSQFVDENQAPTEVQKSLPKKTAISQIFNHFKSGSKKDKSRRRTIVIPELPEYGQKPRSLSHDPRSAKESKMIHEAVANGNGIPNHINVQKRKKVEPAPSFKQAMTNRVSHPFFDSLINSELGPEGLANLRISTNEKSHRKSIGGSLSRNHEDHRPGPPPYNGPHIRAPQSYNTFNREFEHQRVHSLHEYSPQPDPRIYYEQHKYQGDPNCVVHYTKAVRDHGPNMYHIFHPTTAYVGPSPFQEQQYQNVHQRQLRELQQRERVLQKQFASQEIGSHASDSPSDPTADYYDVFNAWFAQSGRQQPNPNEGTSRRRKTKQEDVPGRPFTTTHYRSSHTFRDSEYGHPSNSKFVATPINASERQQTGLFRASPFDDNHRFQQPSVVGSSASSAFAPFPSTYHVHNSNGRL
ncbi:hypothetical protein FO519_002526 [Halicephalobus sp. NKZ332]|nr:hypothetical protein FO519_002526 [Halicephalobus sp. NKZ332]